MAGFQPGPMMAVYYATKAYVNSFTVALANELAGSGVTATCLCPGPTPTEFAAKAGIPAGQFSQNGLTSARSVAEAGVRAMHRGSPYVIPGFRNRLLIFAERFLPRGFVVAAVRRMQEKRNRPK